MLTAKNVLLRVIERDDLAVLHKWQNDEEVMRLARSFPDHLISAEALAARYEHAIKGDEFASREFMIEERATRRPIGWASISIQQWNRRATSADIGLAIGERDTWKKGFGTEAAELLLQESFEQLGLHRVGWWTFAENAGSLALAKKLGFHEEGRIRDSVFFDNRYHDSVVLGLLREEYELREKPSRRRRKAVAPARKRDEQAPTKDDEVGPESKPVRTTRERGSSSPSRPQSIESSKRQSSRSRRTNRPRPSR